MDLGAYEEGDAQMPSDFFAGVRESSSKAKLATRRRGTVVNAEVKNIPKYRECLKNHAASSGGHALDGCGEFMAAGEAGAPEALKCATCDCHRNFHRREVEGESSCDCRHTCKDSGQPPEVVPDPPVAPAPAVMVPPPAPTLMTLRNGASISGGGSSTRKKRFRAKYSAEQKEKMRSFANKAGWKIQKKDETAVRALCADLGVSRDALKVWMHNNKRTLGTTADESKSHSESLEP